MNRLSSKSFFRMSMGLFALTLLFFGTREIGSESWPSGRNPASEAADPSDGSVKIKTWSTRFRDSLGRFQNSLEFQGQSMGQQISKAIFDSVASFDLVSFPVGKVNFKLHSAREITNNQDSEQTWTVIDRFIIEADVPILFRSKLVDLKPIGKTLGLGFYVGGRGGFAFADVRQVPAQPHASLQDLEDQFKKDIAEIQESDWYREQMRIEEEARGRHDGELPPVATPAVASVPDQGIIDLQFGDPTFFQDPANNGRWGKIFNRFTFPRRLPYNYEQFKNLGKLEMMTFTATAAIQTGASVDLNFFAVPKILGIFELGANFSTTWEDDITISVFKQEENVALVRRSVPPIPFTSQVIKDLKRLRLRKAINEMKPLRPSKHEIGIALFNKAQTVDLRDDSVDLKNVVKISPQAVVLKFNPFQIQMDITKTNALDLVYRYAVDTADGREAFEEAVLGNMSLSQNRAQPMNADGTFPPVFEVIESDTRTTAHTFTKGIGIGSFGKMQRSRSQQTSTSTITTPEGKYDIYRKANINTRRMQDFLGAYRNSNRNFVNTLNMKDYAEGKEDSFTLLIENTFEKSRISSTAMAREINEIQALVGHDDIFPKIPSLLNGHKKETYFGSCSFYFGFTVRKTQLEKFINMSNEDKIRVLSKASGIQNLKCSNAVSSSGDSGEDVDGRRVTPEGACRFYRHWNRVQAAPTIQDKNEELKSLFHVKRDVEFWMTVVQHALDGEILDYFVTAQNSSFGRIQFSKKLMTNSDRLLALSDQQSSEQFPAQEKIDQNAQVVYVDPTVSKTQIKLEFDLASDPKLLFFDITRINELGRSNLDERKGYINHASPYQIDQKRFKEGKNELIIGKTSTDELGRELAQKLQLNTNYQLEISYSADGVHRGPGYPVYFVMKDLNAVEQAQHAKDKIAKQYRAKLWHRSKPASSGLPEPASKP